MTFAATPSGELLTPRAELSTPRGADRGLSRSVEPTPVKGSLAGLTPRSGQRSAQLGFFANLQNQLQSLMTPRDATAGDDEEASPAGGH